MREIAATLSDWVSAGEAFALAVVVNVRGSAPRLPGAAMAVNASGEVVGSVSGGCVEAAVYELATEVLRSGTPQLASFGISDEQAFSVGLTCGGVIEVAVFRPADEPELAELLAAVASGAPAALALPASAAAPLGRWLAVYPERLAGTLGNPGLDLAVSADARGLLAQGTSATRHYGPSGQRRQDELAVLVVVFAPPPAMLVFGAIDFAAALVRVGSLLGYRVTVCDARPVFATKSRFPQAHEVVCDWPHRFLARTDTDQRSVLVVLTHDPKFDVPLLALALRRPAAYIGAMGSRRTNAERCARLRAAGVSAAELDRLAAPVGLDLGARTPEETAISIAAEIIALRWGGTGRRLATTAGPIHGGHQWVGELSEAR